MSLRSVGGFISPNFYIVFYLKQSLPEFNEFSFGTGVNEDVPEGVEGALRLIALFRRRLP